MAEQLTEEEIQKLSDKHTELFKQLNANVTQQLHFTEIQYQKLIEKGEEKRKYEAQRTGAVLLKAELQLMSAVQTGWTGLWTNIARGPGVGQGGFGEYGVQVGTQIGS